MSHITYIWMSHVTHHSVIIAVVFTHMNVPYHIWMNESCHTLQCHHRSCVHSYECAISRMNDWVMSHTSVSSSQSWQVRSSVLPFLQVMIFRHQCIPPPPPQYHESWLPTPTSWIYIMSHDIPTPLNPPPSMLPLLQSKIFRNQWTPRSPPLWNADTTQFPTPFVLFPPPRAIFHVMIFRQQWTPPSPPLLWGGFG